MVVSFPRLWRSSCLSSIFACVLFCFVLLGTIYVALLSSLIKVICRHRLLHTADCTAFLFSASRRAVRYRPRFLFPSQRRMRIPQNRSSFFFTDGSFFAHVTKQNYPFPLPPPLPASRCDMRCDVLRFVDFFCFRAVRVRAAWPRRARRLRRRRECSRPSVAIAESSTCTTPTLLR